MTNQKMDKVIKNLELMGFDYINHRFSCSGMQCYDEVMQILGVLKKENIGVKKHLGENKMSKYFKLTVSSMSMHSLLIKTPDDINEDDIHRNFRKFDGGSFSSDDGDWEYSETEEIDEEEFEDETLNKCDWEDRYV